MLPSGCGRWGYDPIVTAISDASPDAENGGAALLDGFESLSDAPVSLDAEALPPDAPTLPPDAASPDAAPAPDYCAVIPPLAAPAVIDGKLDPGQRLRPWVPVAWTGTTPLPDNVNAAYAVAWRPEGLYFFVDVTDPDRIAETMQPNFHCGDSVELYVDSDGAFATPTKYDPQGTRQFVIGAPTRLATPRQVGAVWEGTTPRGPFTSTSFVASPTANGYSVEAFIIAGDLNLKTWNLSAGQAVGIDLAHNVSKPLPSGVACDNRLGQYFVRDSALDPIPLPFINTAAFCTAKLLAE
jgi:hypothetical protein